MVSSDAARRRPSRTLAGSTVALVVPAMRADFIGRSALDLAVGLLRSGARALVVGGGGTLVGELQALGGEWIELDLANAGALRRRRNVRQLAALIGDEHVDLFHAHGSAAAACAVAGAKSHGTPVVTSYVGSLPAPSWRRPPEDAQARGRVVIACSEFAAGLIVERHRIAREQVVVVPHAVDTTWFDPAQVRSDRVAALRQAWRLHPDVRAVLVPGRLAASQGQLTLVDAARTLVNGGLRGVAFIIGCEGAADEDYAAQVDARIAAQGLAGIIRRVGSCDDMPAAYALADAAVLPVEHATTFSSSAVEAQAMARPVIAASLGAMPELMLAPPRGDPGPRTGWLVQPHDSLDLARTIAAMLALGRDELESIGAQAYEFATATFAPEHVAAATLTIYDWLLQRVR